jgi:drug/metabolite transporter (DMT)-like permease
MESTPRGARFFDLRFAIASLFTMFGVIVTLTGVFASAEDLAKSDGVNLSLWTGIGMLVLACCFWVWLFAVPPEVPAGHEDAPETLNQPPVEP